MEGGAASGGEDCTEMSVSVTFFLDLRMAHWSAGYRWITLSYRQNGAGLSPADAASPGRPLAVNVSCPGGLVSTLARVPAALAIGAVSAALLLGSGLLAQPQPSPDERQVLADLEALLEAVKRGDAAEIKRYLFAGDSELQQSARDVIAELIAAQKGLERVGRQRFGADGQRLECGFELIVSDADVKAIREAEVTFTEEEARVIRMGETMVMHLRRVRPLEPAGLPQGPWRLRVQQIDELNEDNSSSQRLGETLGRIRLDRYRAMLEATRGVLARVNRGELASGAAAEEALAQGYGQAAADYQKRRAAWFERRWGRGRERRRGEGNW
jgi:hypothetical protein